MIAHTHAPQLATLLLQRRPDNTAADLSARYPGLTQGQAIRIVSNAGRVRA